MNVIETALAGVLIIEPKVFGDQRGFFLEGFQTERYRDAGITLPFVQDNHSRSQYGDSGFISTATSYTEPRLTLTSLPCGRVR